MKWNDFTLLFLWIFLACITLLFWQNKLTEELLYQKLLLDRNLDTIVEDCLYASIEGIQTDFEPIIHTDCLLKTFEQEKNWILKNVEVPLLYLIEKEQASLYSISEEKWNRYPIIGYDRNCDTYTNIDTLTLAETIQRTDEIQEILMKTLHKEWNRINTKKQYQISFPYIEQKGEAHKLEKTGLWYFFSSKNYRANGKTFDFFTHSGARCNRKQN